MSKKADFKPFFVCPLQGRTGEKNPKSKEQVAISKVIKNQSLAYIL
jgi:hypothetical protein